MDGLLVFILIGLLLTAAAGLFFHLQRGHRWLDQVPAYQKKRFLLCPAERAFYDILQRVIGDHARIFVKISLAELLSVPERTLDEKVHRRRMHREVCDFVLCSPSSLSPVLAIKLDERHYSKRQPRQKGLMENALSMAGLPLLRFRSRESYDLDKLGMRIRLGLAESVATGNGANALETMAAENDDDIEFMEPVGWLPQIARRWATDLQMFARFLGGNRSAR